MDSVKSGRVLTLYSVCNNGLLNKFFSRDASEYKNSGETETNFKNLETIQVILKIMENAESDAVPELCQELHNRIAREQHIPETKVKFVDFKDYSLDITLFDYVDAVTGVIYLNSMMDYSNCPPTELVQRLVEATYVYDLNMKVKNHIFNVEKLNDREKYLVFSEFLKICAISNLQADGNAKTAKYFSQNDSYSAERVYANVGSYEWLDKIFKKYNLDRFEEFQEFFIQKSNYYTSLIDKDLAPKSNSAEDEEYNPDDDYCKVTNLSDEELAELEEYIDDEEECEEDELNDDAPYEDYSLLYDALDFDMHLLNMLELSRLNRATKNAMAELFLDELDKSAKGFYGYFDYDLKKSFKERYYDYKEDIKTLADYDNKNAEDEESEKE